MEDLRIEQLWREDRRATAKNAFLETMNRVLFHFQNF